ncbi:uncharacterized protein KY384_000366 [Bacidia gigantensis]|uniref:uncharacterized protein n=1 Tax=Bacidia gigantensis TaxID=2732470 RepID=UPI001D04282A|nr:uncharacterized protein KY384_000366 [Bacidia gigantensis]KAG8526373.1 hypothetical protein KY384_000366 [Bacidia gigantensis]
MPESLNANVLGQHENYEKIKIIHKVHVPDGRLESPLIGPKSSILRRHEANRLAPGHADIDRALGRKISPHKAGDYLRRPPRGKPRRVPNSGSYGRSRRLIAVNSPPSRREWERKNGMSHRSERHAHYDDDHSSPRTTYGHRSRFASSSSDSDHNGRPNHSKYPRQVRLNKNYDDPAYESFGETTDTDSDYDSVSSYDFILPGYGDADSYKEGTLPSMSDDTEKLALSPEPPKQPFLSRSNTTVEVIESKYTGETTNEGLRSAQIVLKQVQPPETRKRSSPLFRWTHFEHPIMDFEAFKHEVGQIQALTKVQKTGLHSFLGRVQRKYDKPVQTSLDVSARYMEPSHLEDTLPPEPQGKDSASRTVTWLCLPYFSLESYAGQMPGSRSSSHPIRTLLQFRHLQVKKARDLQQAAMFQAATPSDHCFHVAQIWSIIIGDSILVTCGRMSLPKLQSESISNVSELTAKSLEGQQRSIVIYNGSACCFALPLADCRTWSDFMSHFWEYFPQSLQFLDESRVLTPEDWPMLLKRAEKKSIRLDIQERRTPREWQLGVENIEQVALGQSTSTHTNKNGLRKTQMPKTRPGSIEQTSGNTSEVQGGHPQQQFASQKLENKDPQNRVEDDASSDEVSATLQHRSNAFHVFAWSGIGMGEIVREDPGQGLPSRESGTPKLSKGDASQAQQRIHDDLSRVELFLSTRASPSDRIRYRNCPQRTREQVYFDLAERNKQMSVAPEDQKFMKKYEIGVDLVKVADSLFCFFLPPKYRGPTVDKYWGAVGRRLNANDSEDSEKGPRVGPPKRKTRASGRFEYEQDSFLPSLRDDAQKTQTFSNLVSQIPHNKRASARVPAELPEAWLHLLRILAKKKTTRYSSGWIKFKNLLDDGMRKFLLGLGNPSLAPYSVFTPFQVVCLISSEFLRGMPSTIPGIDDIYTDYIERLGSDIAANPLDRKHQDRLRDVKQEISAISIPLDRQRQVMRKLAPHLAAGYYRSHYEGHNQSRLTSHKSKINSQNIDHSSSEQRSIHPRPAVEVTTFDDSTDRPMDMAEIQDMLCQDSLELLDKRWHSFQESLHAAEGLEEWQQDQISLNKDSQNTAIYAFTIVTVIFLPLSTVATILGMNTRDIRDMRSSQWVFWAVALPLTAFIILIGLSWTGKMQHIWDRLGEFWQGSNRRHRHYKRMQQEDFRQDRIGGDLYIPEIRRPRPPRRRY